MSLPDDGIRDRYEGLWWIYVGGFMGFGPPSPKNNVKNNCFPPLVLGPFYFLLVTPYVKLKVIKQKKIVLIEKIAH